MIIAIDGPSGVGKSTIAKMLAKRLGFYFLNTGSFYRAVTYSSLNAGIDIKDRKAVLACAENLDISIQNGDICIDGVDVEDKLHLPAIDLNTSFVSSDPELRSYLTDKIRKAVEGMDIVTEGRDTTTVIFPHAECKCYFDASPEIRAKRRFAQIPDGQSLEKVLSDLAKRDENDKKKPVGALKIAPDALYIDTSYLTIEQVCDKVVKAINR